jgi:hypothetical protein
MPARKSSKRRLASRSLFHSSVNPPKKPGILSRLLKIPTERSDVTGKNVAAFLHDLIAFAPAAGRGHFAFKDSDGRTLGFVQLICTERLVQIHRIWAAHPGTGAGSIMMRTLCDLADCHGVEMKLKVIPIGRKPYPMSRKQLKAWYQRFNFAGPRWILSRQPMPASVLAQIPAAS